VCRSMVSGRCSSTAAAPRFSVTCRKFSISAQSIAINSRPQLSLSSIIMDPSLPESFGHRTEKLSTGRTYHFVSRTTFCHGACDTSRLIKCRRVTTTGAPRRSSASTASQICGMAGAIRLVLGSVEVTV